MRGQVTSKGPRTTGRPEKVTNYEFARTHGWSLREYKYTGLGSLDKGQRIYGLRAPIYVGQEISWDSCMM
jgi:hypothetical protein